MRPTRWLADRRADDVSHGLVVRVVYTLALALTTWAVFGFVSSSLAPLVGAVVIGFALLFGGLPLVLVIWRPSAMAVKRRVSERMRIDPEPPPREYKAPKRW